MFQESLVESTAILRTRSRKPVYAAVAVQAAIAAALISIPLLHPEVLPLAAPQMLLTAPPMPKPPQPVRVRVETAAMNTAAGPVFVEEPHTGLHLLPTVGAPSDNAEPSIGPINMVGPGTGLPIAIGGPTTGSGVSVRPEPAAHKSPLAISTGVMAGMLMTAITPVYPPIAKLTHTEGTVVIEAVISTSGRIESAHAVSGPAMLQAAALEAVRNARYHPYLLNGQPTEVQTTVTVNFRMGS